MKKTILIATILTALTSSAQMIPDVEQTDNWYVGLGGGYHSSFVSFSDIDTDIFPTKSNWNSGVFSIFVRGTFGDKGQFGIRPEISFLNRGGKLTEIYSRVEGYYEDEEINDINYKVQARYVDFRLPLMYRFGDITSRFRPYVYVAPIVGFCHGGYVESNVIYNSFNDDDEIVDGTTFTESLHINASKSNMNSLYLAGAVGVGIDWNFYVGRNLCYLGLEADYEYGFSNTYGDDDKAATKYFLTPNYSNKTGKIQGDRKFSGLEVKLTLGIPFSAFSSPKPVAPAPVIVEEPVVDTYIEEVVVEQPAEKPCYSLDEIISLMARGEAVAGKTICAIDDAINFDFGKSGIRPVSYPYLNRLAETLKRTNSHVIVKGHTDNVGSEDFNLNLSKERALAVYNYLISRGVPKANLSYEYFGMSRPVDSNDTEEGRRMNRRVEFEILN